MSDPKTRKREVTALAQASAEMGVSSGTIVTRSESETFEVASTVIWVVPAWQFLLSPGQ